MKPLLKLNNLINKNMKKINYEDYLKTPYKLPDPNQTYMMLTASRGYGIRKGLEAYEATTKTK